MTDAKITINNLKKLCAQWGKKKFKAAWRKATGEAVPDWLK